mgnify:CR=1 FL=1
MLTKGDVLETTESRTGYEFINADFKTIRLGILGDVFVTVVDQFLADVTGWGWFRRSTAALSLLYKHPSLGDVDPSAGISGGLASLSREFRENGGSCWHHVSKMMGLLRAICLIGHVKLFPPSMHIPKWAWCNTHCVVRQRAG